MSLHIQLEGLEDVTAMLNRLGEGAERGLQQGLLRGGEAVRAEAVANVPVATGDLKKSIVVEQTDGTSVTVGPNLEYGIYVEFGTGPKGDPSVAHTTKKGWSYKHPKTGKEVFVSFSGQKPQPFLVPALLSQKDAVIEAIKEGVLGAL